MNSGHEPHQPAPYSNIVPNQGLCYFDPFANLTCLAGPDHADKTSPSGFRYLVCPQHDHFDSLVIAVNAGFAKSQWGTVTSFYHALFGAVFTAERGWAHKELDNVAYNSDRAHLRSAIWAVK